LPPATKDELSHIASRRGLSLYLPALGGRGGAFCLEVGQGRGLPLTLAGTSMSAVSTPTPITRASSRTMACGPSPGACSMRSRRASSIWLGRNCQVSSTTSVHCAGRSTTPSGTTPSRTSRHKAIRSLRAKATIMVLRVPRAFSVRARNHCAKALSFWNMRNRHAN
jgi:hypothetical protein